MKECENEGEEEQSEKSILFVTCDDQVEWGRESLVPKEEGHDLTPVQKLSLSPPPPPLPLPPPLL